MRLKKIYDAIDALAPFALSREYCDTYGMHDNSGILLDCGEEATGIVCSLDLSGRAVAAAKQGNANVIVTHHPAIFYPVSALHADDPVTQCARAGISVISAHLNLDCAPGGIDEALMSGLGGGEAKLMHPLSQGGYGHAFDVCECSLAEFTARIGARFSTKRLTVYGSAPVQRVASFCGAGMDDASVAFALAEGADTFVSSDGKHHLIAALVARGVNVVLLTHYAAEQYGFVRFAEKLKNQLGSVTVVTDGELL